MKRYEFKALHYLMPAPGAIIRVDEYGEPLSAEIARARLRNIIAADREAVPARGWVKKFELGHTWVGPRGLVGQPRKFCRWERTR